MPNMHVAVFIKPKDSIKATSIAHTETDSFSVTVAMHPGNGEASSGVAIFADSLSQLADFGRAIVEQCDMLAGGPATEPASAPDPFLPSVQPYEGPMVMVDTMAPEDDNPF